MRSDGRRSDARGMDTPRNRTLVISALAAALGPLVGNGLYDGPAAEDGQALVEDLQGGLPTVAHVALTLELLGLVAMSVLFACLVARTFRTSPVAAVTTGIAAAAMLAVKVGSAGPVMVVHATADEIDPAVAEALLDLNDMAFVVSGLLFCLAMAAAGVGLLTTSTPRLFGWSATVLGALGVAAGVVGVLDPDAYVPIPFLLLLLWLIALALATAMRSDESPENPAIVTRRETAPTQ